MPFLNILLIIFLTRASPIGVTTNQERRGNPGEVIEMDGFVKKMTQKEIERLSRVNDLLEADVDKYGAELALVQIRENARAISEIATRDNLLARG